MACSDSTGRTQALLLQYAEGGLDTDTRDEVREHLSECPDCKIKLQEIFHFQTLLLFVDKSAWGDKGECPENEELVLLTESPADIEPERIQELKRHLGECIKCNEIIKRLIKLNQQIQRPVFEKEYPVPESLKARIHRVVNERVRSGAASGEPVAITLDSVLEYVAAQACHDAAARKAPPDQDKVPVLCGGISGALSHTSGLPLRREWVSLIRNGKTMYRVRSSRLGGFHFKNLVPGFYEIGVRATRMLLILKQEVAGHVR